MISVTILTKNSEKYLKRVLEPLARFEEVLILDTGSEDATIAIAKQFPNVTIHKHPFIGFGATHNLASSLTKNDWILSIDSDEIASKELVDEILALSLHPNAVYTISRHNIYRGKWIKGCGWHPDYVIRLYNRTVTRFSEALVHEAVETANTQQHFLQNSLTHYPYRSIDDFLAKMQHYSTLFAKQYAGRKKSSLLHAIGHGAFAFIKSYLLKRGFLLGSQGFEISVYNAACAYYKYLKLRDANPNQ